MPRAHHGARTTWGQKDTRYFDKSAPPQSVERPRHSGASLAVPSHGRPRAHSFDGGRRTAYREPEPEYDDDEPEYSPPPRQAYRAPAPSRAPPAPHGYSSYLGHDEDLGNSSNEDKFTAVGTGVATDLDMDEEEAGMVAGGMAMYGRDPRDGHMHQRSASALAGYDTRLGVHAHQQNNSQGGYHTTMQATQRTRKGDMMSYQDHDLGPAPGLAPPRSIQRPSLADGRRSVHPARYDSPPARYEAPPVSRPPPPEDSPEERQLIRLLKVILKLELVPDSILKLLLSLTGHELQRCLEGLPRHVRFRGTKDHRGTTDHDAGGRLLMTILHRHPTVWDTHTARFTARNFLAQARWRRSRTSSVTGFRWQATGGSSGPSPTRLKARIFSDLITDF